MRSGKTNRVVVLCGIGSCLAVVSAGEAKVNLSLEPASLSVAPGADFAVQLWARADTPEAFDGADVLLQWDSAVATLTGASQEGTSYPWGVSAFLPGSHRNDTWSDGDAVYTCFALPGQPEPQTDVLLTTLRFVASQSAGTTTIRIPATGETEIAAGGVSALGTTSGATVTVGAAGDGGSGGGSGGGGNGGSATNHPPRALASANPVTGAAPLVVDFDGRASSDPDMGDTLAYRWDFGDGDGASGAMARHTYVNAGSYAVVLTVTDREGATATAGASIEVTAGGDGLVSPPDSPDAADTSDASGSGSGSADAVQDAGGDSGNGTSTPPGFVPLCGAGAVECMWLCAAGLFFAGRTRRREWAESR